MDDSVVFTKLACLSLGGIFILGANYWPSYRILSEFKKGKSKKNLEKDYQRFFDLSLEMLCISDFQGNFCQVNPAFAQTLGYSADELLSQPYINLVHPDDQEKTLKQVEKLALGEKLIYFENRYRHADGTYHILAWTAVPYLEENLIYGCARDITKHKQIKTALHFDLLTQLPNRIFFLEQLTQVLEQSQQNSALNFAVLFLDLDNFKLIKDSLPESQGDQLLISITQRFQTCLKTNDILARLSGDEFSLLLVDFQHIQEVIQTVVNIYQVLINPFIINNQAIFINLSIGITFNTNEYNNAETVLRDADIAKNYAKQRGKGQYAIFDQQMRQQAIEQLQLEMELRQSILKQEFVLYYQPIVSLASGQLTEFEALIRWQHPEKGIILPDIFIPIAEKTGLIVALGHWVIQEACQQLQKWQKYQEYKSLKISINLSYQQLENPHLVEQILMIVNQSKICPSCLKIEITESNLIENIEVTQAILHRLREAKITLCLDDFGTGYSSLSYLHQFPFSVVKIDRSFIVGHQTNVHFLEIIKAIITLAHALKMTVVAEGIETPYQFSKLTELSCDYGQGDFFAKPLTAKEAEQLLQQSPQWLPKN